MKQRPSIELIGSTCDVYPIKIVLNPSRYKSSFHLSAVLCLQERCPLVLSVQWVAVSYKSRPGPDIGPTGRYLTRCREATIELSLSERVDRVVLWQAPLPARLPSLYLILTCIASRHPPKIQCVTPIMTFYFHSDTHSTLYLRLGYLHRKQQRVEVDSMQSCDDVTFTDKRGYYENILSPNRVVSKPLFSTER